MRELATYQVVWPSHHSSHLRLAQNYYDLEKINVEWSGTLTTVSPKKYYDLEKINVVWCAQNYHLKKINVEWIMTSKK